jgi:acetyltransferase-like isoleucine patch superfamily enzyme
MSSIDPTAIVHPTADLEAGVSIGAGTSIWHRAQLRRGASIGAGCIVGRDVYIDEDVRVGDRVKIENAALVYNGVTVEDGVFIGPNAVITNDRFPRAITLSGELAMPADWAIGPIHLHKGASIGAGAVVVAGNDVGEFATVGAGAVVTRSVPDHALVAGNPARRIGWVCACGHRLGDRHGHPLPGDGIGEALCQACSSLYEISGDRCVPVMEGVEA